MLIKKTDFYNRTYIHDTDTDKKYRRVWGGVGWPGDKQGMLAIVGEEMFKTSGIRHLRLLKEIESDDMDYLISTAINTPYITEYYARESDKAHMDYLTMYNNLSYLKGKNQLFLNSPPGEEKTGDLTTHIYTIRQLLNPKKKILHFFTGSKIVIELKNLPTIIVNITDIRYPAIAALGYVVSALILHNHEKQESPIPDIL